VTIQVARVNLDDRKVDLELIAGSTRDERRSQRSGEAKRGAKTAAPAPAADAKPKAPRKRRRR
jgi:ribonuclease R